MENTEAMLDEPIQGVEDVNEAEAEQGDIATTPQGAKETGEAEAQKASNEPFLIRYNHEDRELTREEAVQYAQKGLKFDALAPTLDKLSFIATTSGKGAQEWLDAQIQAIENDYRESIIEKYGEDEEVVNMFMAKYKAENESKFNKFKNDKLAADTQAEEEAIKTVEGRIANEFLELQKEFPEITDVSKLPKAVLEQARKGKDLTDAYLRYQHQEKKRIASAKQTAKANTNASTGTMNGGTEAVDPVFAAFMKGLH